MALPYARAIITNMLGIRRNVKKALYAIAFGLVVLSIFGFIGYGGWELLRRPGGIKDEPIPYQPIIVEQIDAVVHADTVDIAARVRNPNPRVGIPEYTVTFRLQDANGQDITEIKKQTFILPGSLNYISVIDAPYAANLSRVKVDVPVNPVFMPLPELVPLPEFNSFLQDRIERIIGNRRMQVQRGIVTNTSTLDFSQVEITGVALDSRGQVVGVGSTIIGEMRVGQRREFTLQWPTPSRPVERVIVLPTTNVYRDENILRTQGDPASLR